MLMVGGSGLDSTELVAGRQIYFNLPPPSKFLLGGTLQRCQQIFRSICAKL